MGVIRWVGAWILGVWLWLDLDARDGFFFVGLALLASGLWWMWPPVALAVCGLILVLYALLAAKNG